MRLFSLVSRFSKHSEKKNQPDKKKLEYSFVVKLGTTNGRLPVAVFDMASCLLFEGSDGGYVVQGGRRRDVCTRGWAQESIYALFVGAIVPGGGDSMTNSDDIVSAKSHKAPRLPAFADANRTRQIEASILPYPCR